MSEQVIYVSNNVKSYSETLRKLIGDISDELNKGIKDGFAFKLANVENEETETYNFIKNQGYDIKYKEFTEFVSDCKGMIEANEKILDDVSKEQITEELSDNDLEQVSGGKGWWKKNWSKVAMGVGAALVVGAVLVATGGLGAPLLAAGIASQGAMLPMIGMGVVTAHAGLATGCAIAAGAGAVGIAAGAIGNALD